MKEQDKELIQSLKSEIASLRDQITRLQISSPVCHPHHCCAHHGYWNYYPYSVTLTSATSPVWTGMVTTTNATTATAISPSSITYYTGDLSGDDN